MKCKILQFCGTRNLPPLHSSLCFGTTHSKYQPLGQNCSLLVFENSSLICSGLCLFILKILAFFSFVHPTLSGYTCYVLLRAPGPHNRQMENVLYLYLPAMQIPEQTQHAHLAAIVFPQHQHPCTYRTFRSISEVSCLKIRLQASL